ncbi:pyridoxamine 5'-phosphate oxidase family protein [Pantoea cypripedii]|uniref:5-nitroimidazole antibiotic resistance protein n=1 Tax=Pantoea cypripedii TaxID=55209 RepID=A0A1X1EK73_PANCY|nr:pyridoxamine 5'-phosphate oxidase family protein [Pantoea cypripedii]MBP2198837.1 nitroimidazol reductase NimA-like FMN-containing flavoprotein (pyridoxamine 5'-phosphate oxidase superfamily) [Pantoea cypripedii]ORM89286.1 5-nitroimidazole antibiotic resistance protein [Pantoea cypripedii]
MSSTPLAHPHGAMRRDEREITEPAQIDAILQEGRVMYIALACEDMPFLLPVFYVWDGTALWFHSARSGSKIDMMKRNANICFAVSSYGGIIEDPLACNFEARHRTVIGLGKTHFVDDDSEKVTMLHRLMARFSDKTFTFPAANLTATQVIRIDITSLKGKQHGY